MRFEPNQFHDPSLRRAIRRAWGHERAPTTLRGRIRQMMRIAFADQAGDEGQNGSAEPAAAQAETVHRHHHSNGRAAHSHDLAPADRSAPSRWSIGNNWHQLAAAALVFLCFGIILYQVHSFYREFYPAIPTSFTAATILPQATVAQLIEKHDECAQRQDHHTMPVSRQNIEQIARLIGQQLGCQVLAADLSDEGWTFNGASTCRIGKSRVSHLLFVNDDKTISLFTLPTSPCGGTLPGWTEEAIFADHFVAAFQKDGALHAVVAYSPSGNLEMSEITSLRDRLRRDMQGKTRSQ